MRHHFADEFGEEIAEAFQLEAEETSMIVLVGATGAGKRHFINSIVPGACATSARLGSCTQSPSANCTVFDDAIILSEIARLVAVQSAMGVQMKGILYLHDILSARMTGEAVRQLELLQQICGEECWDHVTFVTTKWPDEANQLVLELGTKESDLRRVFWRPMLRKKAKMFRFENTRPSAETIIRSLMAQTPANFALLKEMNSGKTLAQTTAGQFVIGSRRRDEGRYQALKERLDTTASSAVPAAETDPGDDAVDLYEHIQHRKDTEDVLEEDVAEEVEKDLKTRMKDYLKGDKKPTVASIISLLIGLSSFAFNLITNLT